MAGSGHVDDTAGRREATDIRVEAAGDGDRPGDRRRESGALSQLPSLDLPMQNAVCPSAVELYRHLPSAVRFTSMRTTSDGQYTLEGSSPGAEVESLFGFLDTLREVPTQVSLSYWSDGGQSGGQYRFAYRGLLELSGEERVISQTWAQAAASADEVAATANQSGLSSVSMGAPESSELGPGMTRLRHELTARGTFRQIHAFARSLGGATARATLAKLVIEPLDGTGTSWREAKLHADVDIVVAP